MRAKKGLRVTGCAACYISSEHKIWPFLFQRHFQHCLNFDMVAADYGL